MTDASIETISAKTKAIWVILTIAGSVLTAIVSTTIYINSLIRDVSDLKKQVAEISNQLKVVNPRERRGVDYNGRAFPQCDQGSFITGLTISVDDHFNSHGQIECAKVQPAIK